MAGVVIDTNLLLLLIVGNGSREDINYHRRLYPTYNAGHFDILMETVGSFSKIIVTPHSLTEASNLLDMASGIRQYRARSSYVALVTSAIEVHYAAKSLLLEPEFERLGLADVAQIMATSSGHTLLTTDGPLYAATAMRGLKSINFWHVWEAKLNLGTIG